MTQKIYFIIVFIPIILYAVLGDQDVTDLCPTRKKNPIGHTCQKTCTKAQDCPRKRLKCLCDGECGMSCITPRSSCPWPVILENANTSLKQETWNFGDQMLVHCHPGYKMANGQEMAQSRCQGDKKWSVTAPCDVVSTCKDPPSIENGYFEKKGHLIEGAVIEYKCNAGYRLEGPVFTECLENKTWSNNAPICITRCKVPVQRSQVIYRGQKVWVTEIEESLVHHSETVKFFCQNRTQACSYTAASQCFDGELQHPECYKEPTWVQYTFFPKNLVSEIPLCEEL
ncbi:protein lev-9-like isoform X2 [Hyla sarda]|uniref:protein lev-9-like isoform X2 n=1 Tax=Hyla sarda TaxID=327740 RepID=UPI0024C3B260|nr:protein lev-9-like isoform X2 [Hyla sarda]